MTTLEVTVLDDSKASFILSLLKEFRYISISNITKEKNNIEFIKESEDEEIIWSQKKIDAITHASILDSIEKHKKGDTSHLIQVNSLKEVFYDL